LFMVSLFSFFYWRWNPVFLDCTSRTRKLVSPVWVVFPQVFFFIATLHCSQPPTLWLLKDASRLPRTQ
jgi:hypothetical protein